jgi:hypothetical protein
MKDIFLLHQNIGDIPAPSSAHEKHIPASSAYKKTYSCLIRN